MARKSVWGASRQYPYFCSLLVGLFVAIPAMFAYNYMVTTIRAITQELDNFTSEYATAIEHTYVEKSRVRAVRSPRGTVGMRSSV